MIRYLLRRFGIFVLSHIGAFHHIGLVIALGIASNYFAQSIQNIVPNDYIRGHISLLGRCAIEIKGVFGTLNLYQVLKCCLLSYFEMETVRL